MQNARLKAIEPAVYRRRVGNISAMQQVVVTAMKNSGRR